METRYRTRIKDDSLKNVVNENRISKLKIEKQSWLILLISLIAVAIAFILYLLNQRRRKDLQEKRKVELLKAEADHRVKNTLTTINSIIRIVKSQSDDKANFAMLEQRISPLMLLYKLLNTTVSEQVLLQSYFESICEELKTAYGHNLINLHISAPVRLEGKKAAIAGLIVNELVTNSLKYAFPNRNDGNIAVVCKQQDNEKFCLLVSDNGKGYREGDGNAGSKGLFLVKALAEQLGATMRIKNAAGTQFEFYFT